MVVFVTIWTPIPLKETCAAQLRLTHHAQKVFRVPHLTQCCDDLPRIILIKKIGRNIKSIPFKCMYGNNSTFPTMHFLHEAQLPFAVVCTPIFSRSELRPPSRSSIISVFLLTVEASGTEVLQLLSLFTSGPSSVFLSTDCCCVDGSKSCKIKNITFFFFLAYHVIFEALISSKP